MADTEMSGLATLRDYFAAKGGGADAGGGEAEPSETQQAAPSEEAPPPAPPAGATQADPRDDPRVRSLIDEELGKREQARAQAQAEAAYREWLGNLSDAQYGAYARQSAAQFAQYEAAKEQMATKFYDEATRQALEGIAELADIPDELRRAEGKATFAEAMQAWIDHAANKRADKLVAEKLPTAIEAARAQEIGRLAREVPPPPKSQNAAPADDELPSNAKGIDHLRAYYRRKEK